MGGDMWWLLVRGSCGCRVPAGMEYSTPTAAYAARDRVAEDVGEFLYPLCVRLDPPYPAVTAMYGVPVPAWCDRCVPWWARPRPALTLTDVRAEAHL